MTVAQSNKLTCSVGVTAYNEERNIGPLLEALINQLLHQIEIGEIIVVSYFIKLLAIANTIPWSFVTRRLLSR